MIAVTGANGYVGGRILSYLRTNGIDAIALVRRPTVGDERARCYVLGEPLDESLLDGIELVVHAAYDSSQQGEDIHTVNVSGSLPLLEGLAERGGRMLMISSLSAFEGARSLYGCAKIELERAVLERGGIALRPGLVFGVGAGGMFGSMVKTLSRHSLTPMIGGGWQRLFLTHDEQLARLVAAVVTGEAPPKGVLFAAHEVPTTLRAIATQIVQARDSRLTVVPFPSPFVHFCLRCAEVAGVSVPFRSDSLRSLLSPIPLDQVSELARSPVEFPPLTTDLWLGS
jgi:nucleoside-diphosphate-sugar epimerase